MIAPQGSPRLAALHPFGSDPGALQAKIYIPDNLPANSPLVVVLHGSMQTAEIYDHGSGWSKLADQLGVAMLYPQQIRANNLLRSFNWFKLGDSHRGGGEPLSIRQMIQRVVIDFGINPQRIFVTGLSSGGAMASVMLATYPEVFASGAVIGGLPYRTATSVMQAFFRMKGYGGSSGKTLDALVRRASANSGRWPTISVWHGTGDDVVHPSNATAIVRQWQRLHRVEGLPTRTEIVDGYPRRVWCDHSGREVIEEYVITKMGHGTPLQAEGSAGYGEEGKFMLEVGISSTRHIAAFWGLGSAPR